MIPRRYFTKDPNTLALYRFDEGQGDQLNDSSGNNLHGRIFGAKGIKNDRKTAARDLP